MCSNIKLSHMNRGVGSHLIIHTKEGSDIKPWQIGKYYNARVENINNFWKDYKYCYTEVSGFFEGRAEFSLENRKLFKVASLYNDEGFVMLTRPATRVVKPYHLRQPVILLLPDLFIKNGQIVEIDYDKLRHIA